MRRRWRNWKASQRSRLRFVVLFDPSPRITANGLERRSRSAGTGLFISAG